MSRWELFIKFALLSSTSILSSMSLSRKTLTLITLAWTMLFITVGARPEFPFPGEKPVGRTFMPWLKQTSKSTLNTVSQKEPYSSAMVLSKK